MAAPRESPSVAAILFDNDGVLVDTEGLFYEATREALASIGVELTLDEFIRRSLGRGQSTFDLARQRGLPEDQVRALRAERDRVYGESLQRRPLVIDGVEEVLRRLHGRVRMGIVTSCRREHFRIIHARSGLLGYFDFTVVREDYERAKPAPDGYRTALERHRLDAGRCLVIEDSPRGLAAARAAGLRCYIVPHELTRNGDFTAADRVLETLTDLLDEFA